MLLGLKGIAIAVLVTAALTAAGTARLMNKLCNADKYESQVAALNTALERERLAGRLAAEARDRLESNNAELETKLAEFADKLAPTAPSCIDRDAARRLRGN